MTTQTKAKWTPETIAALVAATNGENPVSAATVNAIAVTLEISARSVASKLRNIDIEVDSLAVVKAPSFTPEQGFYPELVLH